ncbi:hypothetical protein B0A55_04235 [Friedmanniomyces simplex]|uniref:Zn(2)-C6 fungal-type domain-containing protein n=1 Tax=Friedmanniomyces simplex TaxID=329884 RepID=A0A4U0XRQ4_9PEZI|nr:hypothetical protein B0A55_04235 [Friedmanniomyces simplex]
MDAASQASPIGLKAIEETVSSPSTKGNEEVDKRILTSKRQAQNRSAQRNLRQRKLQHVRDLEDGIELLHGKQTLLHTNNELLKLQLEDLKIENQVLRATIRPTPMLVDAPMPVCLSRSSRLSLSDRSGPRTKGFATIMGTNCCSSPESDTTVSTQEARIPIPRRAHKKSKTGCRTCKQRKVKCDERRPLCLNCERHFTNLETCDFDELGHTLRAPVAPTAPRVSRRPPSSRDPGSSPRKTLMTKKSTGQPARATKVPDGLTINAAWQALQNHPQYLLDRVDVTRFCEGLRRLAAFNGTALVFERARVLMLIEESSQISSAE